MALSRRRDVGAGLVAPRAGPRARGSEPRADRSASRCACNAAASSAGESASLLTGVAYGSIADSINDFVKDNKALTDIIAARGGASLADSYLAMSFRILALVGGRLRDPVGAPAAQRGDRAARRADPGDLGLAVAVGRESPGRRVRRRAHCALVVAGLSVGVSDAAVTGDLGCHPEGARCGARLTRPRSGSSPGSPSLFIGFAPRAAAAASWAFLAVVLRHRACSVNCSISRVGQGPVAVPARAAAPRRAMNVLPLIVLIAVGACLTAAGLAGLRRRDIG